LRIDQVKSGHMFGSFVVESTQTVSFFGLFNYVSVLEHRLHPSSI
jgi:hypothetical protein